MENVTKIASGMLKFTLALLILFMIIGIIFVYETAKDFIKKKYHNFREKSQYFERSGYFFPAQTIEEMLENLHNQLE